MKIFNIILLILLTIGIQAKSNKWKPLKYIDDYPANAFKLKKGVEYLEIRQYEIDENNKLRKTPYKTVLTFYRKSLKSFDKKTVKKFRKLTPNLSKKSNISMYGLESNGIGCNYIYNGFTIDDKGKMLRMNMIEDVISFLGEIDTPVELQVVLLLHKNTNGYSYRKTSKGYDVIIEYDVNLGECKSYKYRATIDKEGKIIKYKLLKSKNLKNEDCIESASSGTCGEE